MLVIRWPRTLGVSEYTERSTACSRDRQAQGDKRTGLLAGIANGLVILVQDDADLVHQTDLLRIVTRESIGVGVDIGEETEDGLGGDGLRRDSSRCRHDEDCHNEINGKAS